MTHNPSGHKDRIVGQKFGKLMVMQRLPSLKTGAPNVRARVLVQCDCGTRLELARYYLLRKHNPRTSCGCNSPRMNPLGKKFAPEFQVWSMMHVRCYDSGHTGYKHYGGRGIRVCAQWHEFEPFLQDMGRRPSPAHTLDRINNDGNYEKMNCRWATFKEQAANKGRNQLPSEDPEALEAPEPSDVPQKST